MVRKAVEVVDKRILLIDIHWSMGSENVHSARSVEDPRALCDGLPSRTLTVDTSLEVLGLPMRTDKDEPSNDTLLVQSAHFLPPFKPVLVGGVGVFKHG